MIDYFVFESADGPTLSGAICQGSSVSPPRVGDFISVSSSDALWRVVSREHRWSANSERRVESGHLVISVQRVEVTQT